MLRKLKYSNVSIRDLKHHSHLTPSQILLLTIMDTEHCSLQSLAKKVGIPIKTAENLLSGKTKDPRVTTFHKLFFAYCGVYVKYRLNTKY